jgi:predicted hydrocarbon binding protein
MYGLINQAIMGLVTDYYGVDAWEKVRLKAEVKDEFFLANKIYDDELTFNLVGASSEILKVDAEIILREFGKYWVLKIAKEKYGKLMEYAGNNFLDFMDQLPNFHSRVMLLYPEIIPPEFLKVKIDEQSFLLHYYSKRHGLGSFMTGLIEGLAMMYNTNCDIELIESEITDISHIVYKVSIK